MMWKENYRIGDPLIDEQHKGLFDKTENLLILLNGDDAETRKDESISMVLYLKNYAVEHFEAEEKYQESINYEFLKEHQDLHNQFITSVLEAEKRMRDSDFSLSSFKEFTGFLAAWLTYHVAGADQKIRSGGSISDEIKVDDMNYTDFFAGSVKSVLNTMLDPFYGKITYVTSAESANSVHVHIGLTGDCAGEVSFTFPKDTVLNLVKALTTVDLDTVDDVAYSVLAEITNIVSGNAVSTIALKGKNCSIDTPQVILNNDRIRVGEGVCLDTNHGQIGLTVDIE